MKIRIDDEPFEVDDPDIIMAHLLQLAGVSLNEHYIQRIEGNHIGMPYLSLGDQMTLKEGDRFVTVYTGACTAQ